MEYIALLNNYLEYSLDDNHTVNLSFQSILDISLSTYPPLPTPLPIYLSTYLPLYLST